MKKQLLIILMFTLIGLSSVSGQDICTNDTFISIASLPAASTLRTVSYNTDVYAFGYLTSTSPTYKYSTTTNSWSTLADMPTFRAEVGAAEVNGVIYCLGGYTGLANNKNEAYDIATNTWSEMADLPTAITGCFAVSLNNKVYVIGSTLGTTITYFYEYNPATNTYVSLTTPSLNRLHANLIVYNNKIYFVGGFYYNGTYNISNSFDEYDPALNTWSPKPTIPINVHRADVTIYDNKLYLFGGTTVTTITPLNSFYVYDFVSNNWTTMANMPFSRASMEAQTVNNSVYLFAGHTNASTVTDLCYKYYCLDLFCAGVTASITPSGNTTICEGSSVVLSASEGASYLWSPGGATTEDITATSTDDYSVTVTDANGCSATSLPITVTVQLCISNEEIVSTNSFSISPNPATTQLTIKTDNTSQTDYSIYDVTGRILSTGSFNQNTNISISDFAEGNYFIQLTTNQITTTRKFIKQ